MIGFEWKKGSKDGPKSIKFMKDEKLWARSATKSKIDIYESSSFEKPKYRLIAD